MLSRSGKLDGLTSCFGRPFSVFTVALLQPRHLSYTRVFNRTYLYTPALGYILFLRDPCIGKST
jgi:hypothetical protein